MNNITIKEIAEKAGVSIGTVDRALHNRSGVAIKTKELILKIAREGNYKTNHFARTLKLNRVFRIAIYIPEDNEYWLTIKKGIENKAAEYSTFGLRVIFFTFDRNKPDDFIKKGQLLLKEDINAVVFAPIFEQFSNDLCDKLDARSIPYVFIDSNLKNRNYLSFIGQNSFQSGLLAARLLTLGYRGNAPLYIVRFDEYDNLNKTIEERINGFKEFLFDKNIEEKFIKEVTLENQKKLLEMKQFLQIQAEYYLFVPNSRAYKVAADLLTESNDQFCRIVGYDAIHNNIKMLEKEKIDFIIDQSPLQQGELCLQALHEYFILNQSPKKDQFIALNILTRENIG